jgi:biopolymer transport protein ExbB/TolQ
MFFVVPAAIGIINAFVQIATQKQTGLGAVAGGLSEMAVAFGLVVIVGSQVAAIVMLLRTLSRSHPIRTIIAIFSVCCSRVFLLVMGLILWSTPLHQ